MKSTTRWLPVALEEGMAVASMVLLVAITLLNVLTRYFTDESYAWTEEISIFLMIVMTLAGAASAASRDQHIRIEFFYESGSAARQSRLKIIASCMTALLFLILTVLFSRTLFDEVKYAETSMGLGVPRWWYTAVVPVLCALITLRALVFAWRSSATDTDVPRPSTEGPT
jgi:TRAP-type C4-dicarboxylate transport system permease small subunit